MRIEQLTFTRFIAAVAVVIFHFGREVFPFQHPILQPLVLSANIGVSYFFILSGFVMIIAYNKQPNIDYKQFYISRIARIFPAFLVSIFFDAYLLFSDRKRCGDKKHHLTNFVDTCLDKRILFIS
jgi:peptidoglycan/LPS O-acetylase OafA/YrhL